ncbi:Putative DNA-directed DNA polymerase, family B, exonuclease domain, ribonuclease H-like superfamily [Colletotrichum destructivum]|uniref:DNA polymerase n=1 Tax=Colletotrichum destructivum TaxID=34406 RepID=A0AAX4J270_9PEZI|nr:Putative DNA-directed DNA polymerase, family B, exonuclease domain, ribonuclease H-like superfamily [Colletotrichum destructivum]
MDLFRVRLNCIDHYQATPTHYDPQLRNDVGPGQAKKGPKVPVVRVFGSTETGQKVCAHIHGAFPYLYVEYQGSLEPEEVGAYIYRLHLSIDHALAVSYRRDQYGDNAKFVARITLVKGIPFYGFHVGYRFFLKIYMFNPIVMTRLADLLQQGVILKSKFQPYEAHLQYLLQFMTDYNLYGCGYLETSDVYFRGPVPSCEEEGNSQHLWHDRTIPHGRILDDLSLPRVSHCSVEVDICVQNIINRHLVKERRLHHEFVERVKPLPADVKLVYSMAGLWKDETRRRKLKMPNADPGSSPFPAEVLVSMSANARDSQPQGWIHEKEYKQEVGKLIEAEKDPGDQSKPNFETFVEQDRLESTVNTALQSVEDLYPANLLPALGLPSNHGPDVSNLASSIEVDEQGVLDLGGDDFDPYPADSDEEALVQMEELKPRKDGDTKGAANPDERRPSNRRKPSVNRSRTKPSNEETALAKNTANELESDLPLPQYKGVHASRLKTGKPPNVPAWDDLLIMAEEEGLVSKLKGEVASSRPRTMSAKRSLSPSGAAMFPAKRSKNGDSELSGLVAPALQVPSKSILHIGLVSEKHNVKMLPSYTHEPPGLSQTTGSKPAANSKLAFPVVKSQDDPGTKLRLSQLSQPRASQQGDEDFQKHLSFNLTTTEISNNQPKTPVSTKKVQISEPSEVLVGMETILHRVQTALGAFSAKRQFLVGSLPPASKDITSTLKDHQIPDVIYQDAYFSEEKDVPARPREYAGREFRLESNTLPFLADFDPNGTSAASMGIKPDGPIDKAKTGSLYEIQRKLCSYRSWEIAQPPPTFQEVRHWWEEKHPVRRKRSTSGAKIEGTPRAIGRHLSQVDGPTPKNKHGFKYSLKKKSTGVKHEAQYMSTMALEVHVNTRGKFVPNPDEDEVRCIFWSIKGDSTTSSSQATAGGMIAGVVVLSPDGGLAARMRRYIPAEVVEEASELDLMVRMVEVVRSHDPDILTGYEVHGSSWGYLIERARVKYDYDLCDEFSRMKSNSHGRIGKENDRWGFNTTSTIRVTGRHMINIWRAMRGELNLLQYTMENVAWHVLHRRIPHYTWQTLTEWYNSNRQRDLDKLLRYYLARTRTDIQILESNELIPRTSEQARLLGVDFFSVFSRGSQFKVESIMFRIAKPENFMLVSPSRKQVGGQNALECLPLVMEPQSDFYNSPLLVLDFQSLYPSVMIAYNLCYSTFLGRIVSWRGMNKMGFTEYQRHKRLLELLKDYINITPNGMMFVRPEIRKSLLAKMLGEILETRVMVKAGMKQDKDDKTLQKLLNNRQLALKLLANVTYGYTSASFSGRMPCSEIADSIVQTGRETLERAIAFIHSQERWGAEVVYGDTDSLFVNLKGRTKDQAFDIGNEIAKAITDMNPRPIKLKFEKVYHPCVLLAKKRYVGYKYESKDQTKPEFDAKGIETVRRDGTPAEQKIEEKALRILFETADLSEVKAYFQQQCEKIMRGKVSVQDFCYAREVKLGTYSDKGPPPPGALISTKKMLEDARAEPQYGERVPYVVITGAPGARLIDRCVAPEDLLKDSHSQLDAEYYISKNLIPPLERIFNLVGANVRQWYDEMPKVQRIRRVDQTLGGGLNKKTLESYLKSASCVSCHIKMQVEGVLCSKCQQDAPSSLYRLQTRLNREERKYMEVVKICRSCSAMPAADEVPCDSKDCPVFYSRVKQNARLKTEKSALEPVIAELVAKAERASLEW